MTGPVAITADDLRTASWRLATHLNSGAQGHAYTYTAPEFPEAMVCKGWSKTKTGRQGYAVMQIGRGEKAVEVPLGDLDEVARVISKARQTVIDDAEWDATDPAMRASA